MVFWLLPSPIGEGPEGGSSSRYPEFIFLSLSACTKSNAKSTSEKDYIDVPLNYLTPGSVLPNAHAYPVFITLTF